MSFLPVLYGPRGPRDVAGCRSGAAVAARNPCVKVGTFGPVCLPETGAAHAAAEGGRGGQMGLLARKVKRRDWQHVGGSGHAQGMQTRETVG